MCLNNSIESAITFLLDSRNEERIWLDFHLNGESDEWVTGYVGTILSGTANERAFQAAREAWDTHSSRHFLSGHGGWSFNRFSPEDADSTIWNIRFALNLGFGSKFRTEIAEKFLLRHITPDGGVTTFILEKELRKFLRAQPADDISGWMQTHPCVTAAAAVLPFLNERLAPWLQKNQLADGSWNAYWWTDQEYTLSLAVEALMQNSPDRYRDSVDKAVAWITEKLKGLPYIGNSSFPDGSPFATALALKALIQSGKYASLHETIIGMTKWLIDCQLDDGSWKSSAILRVPPSKIRDPSGFLNWNQGKGADYGTITMDQNSIFTTVTVLDALRKVDAAGNYMDQIVPAALSTVKIVTERRDSYL